MLIFPQNLFVCFLVHARAGLPEECCALLGGTRRGDDAQVARVYLLTNIEHSPTHYSMNAAEQFAAVKDMRKNGWELLGNLHSHPETPARPSREDRRLAFDPALRYLILSLADTRPVLRCFRICGADAETEPIDLQEE